MEVGKWVLFREAYIFWGGFMLYSLTFPFYVNYSQEGRLNCTDPISYINILIIIIGGVHRFINFCAIP